MTTMRSRRALMPVLMALTALLADGLHGQSLLGSRASIDRMYAEARSHDLTFHRNAESVRTAVERGRLVRLAGNGDYVLHEVSYPYVLPSAKLFVERLAAQYRSACGERLVVTSATRPMTLRLANAADRSVHPTGMALDLRRPTNPGCLNWLRATLLSLERQGVIEATEERRPPHFHVAVFPRPYRRYANARGGSTAPAAVRTAAASRATYRVRQGDSLWSIARRHDTTVDRLRQANDVSGNRIVVGQVLVIPAR